VCERERGKSLRERERGREGKRGGSEAERESREIRVVRYENEKLAKVSVEIGQNWPL